MRTANEKIKLWANYDKRRKFIGEYLKWDEWLRIEELGLVFYKYELTEDTWLVAMTFKSIYRGDGVRYYIHNPNKPFQPFPCMEHELEQQLKKEKMRLQKMLKTDNTTDAAQSGNADSSPETFDTNKYEEG